MLLHGVVAQAAPPAAVSAPVNTALPVISGSIVVGATLTCSTGDWDNSPTSFAYQWLNGGIEITDETESSYELVAADEGDMISCEVDATNAAGSTTATAAAVGPIEAAGAAEAVAFGGETLIYSSETVEY